MNKLSIYIPCYNRVDLTLQTLRSITQQTLKPHEVILVDDCSTDDISPIKTYCNNAGFKFLQNTRNLGLMQNISDAVKYTTGDYVSIVHNDDVVSPFYTEFVYKFLNKYPGFVAYTTNCIGLDENSHIIAEYRLFREDHLIQKQTGFEKLWSLGYTALITAIGSTVYSTAYLKEHPFNPELGNEADLDVSLRLLSEENVMYVDLPIYFTRIHHDQMSHKIKQKRGDMSRLVKNRIEIYKKYALECQSISKSLYYIKALHLLQLLLKYRYSLTETLKLLDITGGVEFARSCAYIPLIAKNLLEHRIQFDRNQKVISTYQWRDEPTLEKYNILNHINHKVLDAVVETSFPNCNILDVGCWTGNLGSALKKRLNYRITIDGIDNDSNALKCVRERGIYNKVYEIDLNNPLLSLNMQYDVIVLSDVLEHLINPEKTLQKILKHLSPKGWVVVSLPNVAFIKYRLLHLLGRWDYKDSGIMDRTHLHFYTLNTMQALFKTCNLRVVEQQPLVAILKKYLIISLLSKIAPRVFALQFVFKLSLLNQE